MSTAPRSIEAAELSLRLLPFRGTRTYLIYLVRAGDGADALAEIDAELRALDDRITIGTLMSLRATDPSTYESREASLRLDPWSPEGFRIYQWIRGRGLIICGADRILLLQDDTLGIRASIPLERYECETVGQPWILEDNDALLVSTESRVFCFDLRLAIRWCWTVRVYSEDWWSIRSAPAVEGMHVVIPLRSARIDSTVKIHLDDARRVSESHAP